jgi:hypothetical protein
LALPFREPFTLSAVATVAIRWGNCNINGSLNLRVPRTSRAVQHRYRFAAKKMGHQQARIKLRRHNNSLK